MQVSCSSLFNINFQSVSSRAIFPEMAFLIIPQIIPECIMSHVTDLGSNDQGHKGCSSYRIIYKDNDELSYQI